MNEDFYTIPEVAEKLKVTRAAVYKWMKLGKLDYVVVGSERRITSTALAAFIKEGTEAEKQEIAEKNPTPGLVGIPA